MILIIYYNVYVVSKMNNIQVAERFSKAVKNYQAHAVLQQDIARLLLSKAKSTSMWLDIGAGLSDVLYALPADKIYAVDLSLLMLFSNRCVDKICADVDDLPFQSSSIPAIASNFVLQWSSNLSQSLSQIHRILEDNGQFLFSLPVASSFNELKILQNNHMIMMKELPQSEKVLKSMQSLKWKKLQKTTVKKRLFFKTAKDVLYHFKRTGANFTTNGSHGLKGKRWYLDIIKHLEKYRLPEGIPLTWFIDVYEVIK